MAESKIFLEKGVAYKLVNGKRVAVNSIADQNACDCEVDCCLKAIKLPDHDGSGTKYIYILGGVFVIGTEAELRADSTILN